MIIIVNGTKREFTAESLSVTELLGHMKYTFPNIIVKLKNMIVPKSEFHTTTVNDKDEISIIHLMSGG